jgi:chromosomal replication initiation ATPase DnaA
MAEGNVWADILNRIRTEIDAEEYRRWFSMTSYASDSGDQITVWVINAADGRQIEQAYSDRLRRILRALGRGDTHIRFVVSGYKDDEDDDADE